jgi:hypothetical protein
VIGKKDKHIEREEQYVYKENCFLRIIVLSISWTFKGISAKYSLMARF